MTHVAHEEAVAPDDVLDAEPTPADAPAATPPAPRAPGAWAGRAISGVVGLAVGVGIGVLVASRPVEPDSGAAAVEPPRLVELPEALADNAGIEVRPVTEEAIAPTLDLVGTVDFDQGRVADIGGRSEGRIVRMFVSVGDIVEEGQPLVQIESPVLGEAMAALLAARARLEAARTSAERETSLRQRQLTTAGTLETATATAEALEAEVRGAEQRLLALGISEGELRQVERSDTPIRRMTLRSPIAGEVIERYAHLGQVVSTTAPVLRVADLSSVWVTLEVYERDLTRVRVGDTVDIISESYPGETFAGTVSYLDATIDERTRSAGVRIVVQNEDRRLRPGHFVHAMLTSGDEQRRGLMLPRRAIVQLDGLPTVFVSRGERRFEPRAVELGANHGDQVEILAGLAANEPVVVSGAFALKSELQR
ncbi:MAG: efflux RND transporter periplasmic adaptor subunit [Sandaracinaceae bacterium]|nr:efflux RND transporter periplasmic adaptor subunit [Sandaracinaceae bacterium]